MDLYGESKLDKSEKKNKDKVESLVIGFYLYVRGEMSYLLFLINPLGVDKVIKKRIILLKYV